jgi:hypothetical protein
LADCGSEKILKKLVGNTDVEDALLRLDVLTKEEDLMMVMKNLEVAYRIDDNVEEAKVLVKDINDKVKGIEGVACSVDNGAQHFLSVITHILTFSHCVTTVAHELKRLSLPGTPTVGRQG